MVALHSRKSSEYRPVAARVSMTPNFLLVNNLDGAVYFVGRLWLLHPIALLKVLFNVSGSIRRTAQEFGWKNGVVAKRKDSLYQAGQRAGAVPSTQ
jgi:hypothetical protein